jgi:hypothetical protein
VPCGIGQPAGAGVRGADSAAGMRRWRIRPEGSNWGEFGDDDQIGRMNLLTPARRAAAAREVREGVAFTLSLPLDLPGGGVRGVTEREPPRLFAKNIYQRPIGDLVHAPC